MTDEHTGIDLQDRCQAGTDSDSCNRHRGWGQKTQGTWNRKLTLSSLLVKWYQREILSFLNMTPTYYRWYGIYSEYVLSVHTLHPFIFPRYYLWFHISLEKILIVWQNFFVVGPSLHPSLSLLSGTWVSDCPQSPYIAKDGLDLLILLISQLPSAGITSVNCHAHFMQCGGLDPGLYTWMSTPPTTTTLDLKVLLLISLFF